MKNKTKEIIKQLELAVRILEEWDKKATKGQVKGLRLAIRIIKRHEN